MMDFRRLSAAVLAAVGLALAGCAFTKDYVSVGAAAGSSVARAAGAEGIEVSVEVEDLRGVKDRVSSKKNGYGMETASIVARNDVVAAVGEAVRRELRARGFGVSGRTVVLAVDLIRFYCDFELSLSAGKAAGEVALRARVQSPSGRTLHRASAGAGASRPVRSSNGKEAEAVLNEAFSAAISDLFGASGFVDAIIAAGRGHDPASE